MYYFILHRLLCRQYSNEMSALR